MSSLFYNKFTLFEKIKPKIRDRSHRLRHNNITDTNWDGKQTDVGLQDYHVEQEFSQYENVWDPFQFDKERLRIEKSKKEPKIDPRYYQSKYEEWEKVKSKAGQKYRMKYVDIMKMKNWKAEAEKAKKKEEKRSQSMKPITRDMYLQDAGPSLRKNFLDIMREDEQRDYLIRQGIYWDELSSGEDNDSNFKKTQGGRVQGRAHSVGTGGFGPNLGLYKTDRKMRLRTTYEEKMAKRMQGNNYLKFKIQEHEKTAQSFVPLVPKKKRLKKKKRRALSLAAGNSLDNDSDDDDSVDNNVAFKEDSLLMQIGKKARDLLGYESIFGKTIAPTQQNAPKKRISERERQMQLEQQRLNLQQQQFYEHVALHNSTVPIFNPVTRKFTLQGNDTGQALPEFKPPNASYKGVTRNSSTNNQKQNSNRLSTTAQSAILRQNSTQLYQNQTGLSKNMAQLNSFLRKQNEIEAQTQNNNSPNRAQSANHLDVSKLCNTRPTLESEQCFLNNPLVVYQEIKNRVEDPLPSRKEKKLLYEQEEGAKTTQYECEKMGFQSSSNDLYNAGTAENKQLRKIIERLNSKLKGKAGPQQRNGRQRSKGPPLKVDPDAYYNNYFNDFPDPNQANNYNNANLNGSASGHLGQWSKDAIYDPSYFQTQNQYYTQQSRAQTHALVTQTLPTYEEVRDFKMEKLSFEVDKKQLENDRLEFEKIKLQFELVNKQNMKLQREVALLKSKCGQTLNDKERKIVEAAMVYKSEKQAQRIQMQQQQQQQNQLQTTENQPQITQNANTTNNNIAMMNPLELSIGKISEKDFELEESICVESDGTGTQHQQGYLGQSSQQNTSSTQNNASSQNMEIDWLARSRKQKQENDERLGLLNNTNTSQSSIYEQQQQSHSKSQDNIENIDIQVNATTVQQDSTTIEQYTTTNTTTATTTDNFKKALNSNENIINIGSATTIHSGISALDKIKQINSQQAQKNQPLFTIVKRSGKQMIKVSHRQQAQVQNDEDQPLQMLPTQPSSIEPSSERKSMAQILKEEEERIKNSDLIKKEQEKAAIRRKVQQEKTRKNNFQSQQATRHMMSEEWGEGDALTQEEKEEICFDMLVLEEERFKSSTRIAKQVQEYGIARVDRNANPILDKSPIRH